MQRLLCIRCGDSIHPDTAKRNNGLCVPCVRGNQLTVEQRNEQRRKERESERAWRESPEYRYWLSLVDRVYKEPGGFGALSKGDQLYYLVNVLSGEVLNGGFDQFFSNSSGDLYCETVQALVELRDQDTLNLLEEAKSTLFGPADCPVDGRARFGLMRTASEDHPLYEATVLALDQLDKRFYANAKNVSRLLERVAAAHNLYRDA
jgi:Domain of unknown function (DUF4375)